MEPDRFPWSRVVARANLAPGPARAVNLALFDSSTLVGKGVKTHLVRRRFPAGKVRLFDTGAVEAGGNLGEFNGEPQLALRPALEEMKEVDLAFFCGELGTGRQYLDWPERGRFVAIDLTLSAGDRRDIPVVNACVNINATQRHRGILASPHSASQFLSTVLAPLARRLPVSEVVSLVMQPASEAGERGIAELYQQTVGLLNFTDVPKDLFGRVLAFNLLPASLGPDGGSGEERVAREVAAILGGTAFPHAVKILLVPVFHCHAFVSWVRFSREVTPAGIREVLAEQPSLRIHEGSGGATPAELAGEENIVLGEIRPDPSTPAGFWLWGVTDNLATGVALNAVRIAEELVNVESLGKRSPK